MTADGAGDTFAIGQRTNVIGDFYCLLARALVTALTGKLIGAFDPSPVLKGIVIL